MKRAETATFGAGCFWHVEEAFRKTKGVTATAVGYMGGKMENPTYEDVCTDETGHAEVVQVEFDPAKISYKHLLDTFWKMHDPTSLNRQGFDVGTQYRSAIFYHNQKQKEIALEGKEIISKNCARPIVTEITRAGKFYRAEEYHQKYLMKKGLKTCL
ncbi:MAG: peptide-methionine (S)-S-oxide reductase MsrA [Candidatus Aenigmarchaeota archaeon]|nr:peptide-methionine (S)-S-oxide reductase MsrA [Candidatus Aenigmarchaeota archaeon]